MANEANPNELYLGRGKTYFDRFDRNGNKTGARFLGEVGKLDLTPNVTIKEHYEHTRAAANKIASIPVQQKHTLSLDMSEGFNPDNAALTLLGDTILLAPSAPTFVTDEMLTSSATLGRAYKTSSRNIASLVLKTGATTLVLGTDYIVVDASLGFIQTLAGGTLTVGEPITCSYTSGAFSISQVRAGTTADIRGELTFIGDPASGPILHVEFWKVQMTPSAAVALITDDFANFTLTGEVLADAVNHPTAPLYLISRLGIVAGS